MSRTDEPKVARRNSATSLAQRTFADNRIIRCLNRKRKLGHHFISPKRSNRRYIHGFEQEVVPGPSGARKYISDLRTGMPAVSLNATRANLCQHERRDGTQCSNIARTYLYCAWGGAWRALLYGDLSVKQGTALRLNATTTYSLAEALRIIQLRQQEYSRIGEPNNAQRREAGDSAQNLHDRKQCTTSIIGHEARNLLGLVVYDEVPWIADRLIRI